MLAITPVYDFSCKDLNDANESIPAEINKNIITLFKSSFPTILKNTVELSYIFAKTDNERIKERYMENFAIFFIPSRLIVGSTRNQWPIIIDENTAEINKIGTKFLILLKPIIFSEEIVNDIKASHK